MNLVHELLHALFDFLNQNSIIKHGDIRAVVPHLDNPLSMGLVLQPLALVLDIIPKLITNSMPDIILPVPEVGSSISQLLVAKAIPLVISPISNENHLIPFQLSKPTSQALLKFTHEVKSTFPVDVAPDSGSGVVQKVAFIEIEVGKVLDPEAFSAALRPRSKELSLLTKLDEAQSVFFASGEVAKILGSFMNFLANSMEITLSEHPFEPIETLLSENKAESGQRVIRVEPLHNPPIGVLEDPSSRPLPLLEVPNKV